MDSEYWYDTPKEPKLGVSPPTRQGGQVFAMTYSHPPEDTGTRIDVEDAISENFLEYLRNRLTFTTEYDPGRRTYHTQVRVRVEEENLHYRLSQQVKVEALKLELDALKKEREEVWPYDIK